jgi:hypothetical protein
MGEAKRRRSAGLAGFRPNPSPEPRQGRVLAMIDRRIEHIDGEIVFSDHSAKPNTYCSADMKTLYQWDGKMLRRIDRTAAQPQNTDHL